MGRQPGDFAYGHFNLPPGFVWVPQNGEGSMEQPSTSTALPREILDVTHLFNIYPPRLRMPYTQAFQNATPQDGEESMELPRTGQNATRQGIEGSMDMQSTSASASHEVEQQQSNTSQNTTPQDSGSLLSDSDDSSDKDRSSEVDELTVNT